MSLNVTLHEEHATLECNKRTETVKEQWVEKTFRLVISVIRKKGHGRRRYIY